MIHEVVTQWCTTSDLCIIYITSNDYEINLTEMPVLNVKVTYVHNNEIDFESALC